MEKPIKLQNSTITQCWNYTASSFDSVNIFKHGFYYLMFEPKCLFTKVEPHRVQFIQILSKNKHIKRVYTFDKILN